MAIASEWEGKLLVVDRGSDESLHCCIDDKIEIEEVENDDNDRWRSLPNGKVTL